MTFNLLPTKWLNNNKSNVSVRKEEQAQEHPVHSLRREMNHIFDDFIRAWDMPAIGSSFDGFPFSSIDAGSVMPRIDVHETDKEIHVSAELPGLTEKDIDVSLSKDHLTLSGEKKQETEQNVKGWYRIERSYGSFARSIPLPCEVDQESCHASFKNGVLTVSLTKCRQAQTEAKRITVKKE
ncbi:MAG: Hsp20/alpha crystallin family protein [Candidatus Obscuribacterales bacterium]|nr:Hsp20/alpha crystallin family protein [Candidatus Obscuribacterales bacterium]